MIRSALVLSFWMLMTAAALGPITPETGSRHLVLRSQIASVDLTVVPGELVLEPGATRRLTAIVTNAGGSSISGVALQWRSETAIEVEPSSTQVVSVGPGSAVPVTFEVGLAEFAARLATADLIVTFLDDSTGVTGAVSGQLTVSPPAPSTAAASLTAELSSAVEVLNQYGGTDLTLTLTNSGAARIVTTIALAGPEFAEIRFNGVELTADPDGRRSLSLDRTLVPGDQTVLIFGLGVAGPLQPGNASLVAEITSRRAEAGSTPTTTVASTVQSFAVLGESALLTAVGVPSLLLVPGLVFAVVVWLLRSRVYPGVPEPNDDAEPGGLDTTVVFWALAIPVGIGICLLYGPLTALIGRPRDILAVYGLDDILYVWILAAATGLLAWTMIWIGPRTVHISASVGRRWYRRRFVPEPGDPARLILRKLARRQPRSVRRPKAKWTSPEGGWVCVLEQRDDKSLIMSEILYKPVNEDVEDALRTGEAKRLATALDGALGTNVRFRGKPDVPTLVDSAQLTDFTAATTVVGLDDG